MSNIEKIKAEIERLKAKYRKDMYKSNYEGLASGYKIEAYNELLFLIDSLPEDEPSEDLEEAADQFQANHSQLYEVTSYPIEVVKELERNAYLAGAKWMKKQMELDGIVTLTESDFDAEKEKASEWGYNLCKEQMMKKVKFGVVCKNGGRNEEDVWIELNPGSLSDYKDTDPIDFIIVKQDDRPRD